LLLLLLKLLQLLLLLLQLLQLLLLTFEVAVAIGVFVVTAEPVSEAANLVVILVPMLYKTSLLCR
jgi:hypothetical protein